MPGGGQERDHRDQQGRDRQACADAECQPVSLCEGFRHRRPAGRQAAGAGRRERAQHGYPQRRSDLLCRVDQARGDPGVGGGRRRHGEGDHRGKGQPEPAHQEHGRQQVSRVPAGNRHPDQQREPGGDRNQPAGQHRSRAEPGVQPGRDADRQRGDHHGRGQHRDTCRGRAVAEHPLHVLRDQHLETERGGDRQRLDRVGHGHIPDAEHPERQQRSPGYPLPGDEPREEHNSPAGDEQRVRRSPPVTAGARDGVDTEHQPGRDQHRPDGVRAGPQADAGEVIEQAPASRCWS